MNVLSSLVVNFNFPLSVITNCFLGALCAPICQASISFANHNSFVFILKSVRIFPLSKSFLHFCFSGGELREYHLIFPSYYPKALLSKLSTLGSLPRKFLYSSIGSFVPPDESKTLYFAAISGLKIPFSLKY